MESNTAKSLSVLGVAPSKTPELIHEIGEGVTYSSTYYEPFDFHGRIFVREYDGENGEYITTHGPFHTEEEALIETVGITMDQIVSEYCTD